MKAFVNTTMTKQEIIDALKWHQEQDNFIKGQYFEDGKGCAVGCSLESVARLKKIKISYEDHGQYEKHFGVPRWLAKVEDVIFEGLPLERSKTWPLEFVQAINVGANLDNVKAPFVIFILESNLENFDNKKYPVVVEAINTCIDLYKKYPSGPDGSAAWSAARSTAWYAAWYAVWSGAESAARFTVESAAKSAVDSAVDSAVWSAARSAVESAAWSATWYAADSEVDSEVWYEAWSAACVKFADKLLELIKQEK